MIILKKTQFTVILSTVNTVTFALVIEYSITNLLSDEAKILFIYNIKFFLQVKHFIKLSQKSSI